MWIKWQALKYIACLLTLLLSRVAPWRYYATWGLHACTHQSSTSTSSFQLSLLVCTLFIYGVRRTIWRRGIWKLNFVCSVRLWDSYTLLLVGTCHTSFGNKTGCSKLDWCDFRCVFSINVFHSDNSALITVKNLCCCPISAQYTVYFELPYTLYGIKMVASQNLH